MVVDGRTKIGLDLFDRFAVEIQAVVDEERLADQAIVLRTEGDGATISTMIEKIVQF